MSGAKAFCETLKLLGINRIFGLPGTTEVAILDELLDHPELDYVLSLEENAVVGMADGYSRACGTPSVVNLHTTPGTLRGLGNLYNAYRDGSSLIVTAGQVSSSSMIKEPILYTSNMIDVTRQFTKWCWEVKNAGNISEVLRRAFKFAATPPRAPVFVSLPRETLTGNADVQICSASLNSDSSNLVSTSDQIEKAAKLLIDAENPLIMAGHDVSKYNAVQDLIELAEVMAIPVVSEALIGLISSVNFPHDHPLHIGFFDSDSGIMNVTDVVLVVGSKVYGSGLEHAFAPIPESANVIRVEVDPWHMVKTRQDVEIIADVKKSLKGMTSVVRTLINDERSKRITRRFARISKTKDEIEAAREKYAEETTNNIPINASRLVKELKSVLDDDAIIVNEGGRAATYLKAYYDFHEPGTLYGSMGAHLGWGLPASMGIKMASPNRQVVAYVGDGAFMFGIQSLWTASKYNIPVIIIVCNNHTYMAPKAELFAYKGKAEKRGMSIGCDLTDPEIAFTKIAESFEIYGERIRKPDNIKPTIKKLLKLERPALIDVLLDPKDTGYKRPRLP